jgi:crotonobetainyl-CoA:carnitine CoA-transferase CaiB-like acyl-CoA transferase
VRVLAVEQYGAGPFGTMFLADQGAEVIKIENPNGGGDISRNVGPYYLAPGDSLFFHSLNRNKKSLTLDLGQPEGQAVLGDLAAGADALACNLRGDVPERLGLTYDHLKARNPRIVCAHLTAYGRDGPRKAWPGFDYLMAYALLAALTGARATGLGRDIDVSLFDVALGNTNYLASWYLNEGVEQQRLPRSAHPSLTPCQLYRTADGWIFIMCNKEKFWPALCEAIGKQAWTEDPRFESFEARLQNRDLLTELMDEALGARATAEWLQVFAGAVPAAPILGLGEALDNPYVAESGGLQTLSHPRAGDFRLVAPPVRCPGEDAPAQAAPALGADTDAILGDLGYDTARIAALRANKVI